MAFSNNFTVGSDGSYTQASTQNVALNMVSVLGTASIRRAAVDGIPQGVDLTISHQMSGSSTKVARRMVRLDVPVPPPEGTTGNTITVSVYVVAVIPQVSYADPDVAEAAFKQLSDFLYRTESGASATNLSRVLLGEI